MTPNDRRMRITGMEGAGTITILPPGTPLIVGIDRAAELFSVSATTLRRLYAMHEDFPAGKLGEKTARCCSTWRGATPGWRTTWGRT